MSSLAFDLWTGIIFAIFNSSGTIPSDIDMFIKIDKGIAICSPNNFITSALKLS